ncbi:hypothetical protein Tco_0051466 [Tanacetum coccineum]
MTIHHPKRTQNGIDWTTFWNEGQALSRYRSKVHALLVTPLSDANEDECFDPGGEIDEIDAFLDMDISTDIENGYHDSERDIIYLESLLIDAPISNLPPEVFLDHDPKSLKDELDKEDLKSMDKVFDPGIHEKIFYPTYIPSGEIKVHIEVLSVLWGNRLPIPDGSLPLSRPRVTTRVVPRGQLAVNGATAGHRSTAAVNGGSDGQRWQSTTINDGEPPLTDCQPLPDHRRTTSQPPPDHRSTVVDRQSTGGSTGQNATWHATCQPRAYVASTWIMVDITQPRVKLGTSRVETQGNPK